MQTFYLFHSLFTTSAGFSFAVFQTFNITKVEVAQSDFQIMYNHGLYSFLMMVAGLICMICQILKAVTKKMSKAMPRKRYNGQSQ